MKVSELMKMEPGTTLHAEIEPLLAPAPGDAPAGPNLEYDRAFMALDTDAQGRAEQRIGDDVIPAEPPNWVDVKARAEALLARTKDLRIALIWLRASTALDGLAGCEAGLQLVHEMTLRYWDTLHPELEGDDATYRCNVLAGLAGPAYLCSLRDMPAARRRGEMPTLREIELAARDKLPPNALAGQHKQLDDAVGEKTPGLEIALRLPGVVRALDDALEARFGAQPSPNLEPLAQLVEALAKAVGDAFGRAAGKAAAEANAALGVPLPTTPTTSTIPATPATKREPHPVTAGLNSRADAIAWLDAVAAFLERTEPAHPAPLLIRRASALLAMDFIGVMRELAPESLDQIYAIAGIRPTSQ